MKEFEDKVLKCRQCGREFCFTELEQEFYMQKGWTEPGHCPRCRSTRRKQGLCSVCSGCGTVLDKEESVYCNNCVDNIKQKAELKHQRQQERINELQSKLESYEELEQRLASVALEMEKIQQANRELKDGITMLQEAVSGDGLGELLQQLNEQFGALGQSYTCDIDKLTGLLLEIQYVLVQQKDAGLWHRMKMALTRKRVTQESASGNVKNNNVASAHECPENDVNRTIK